MHSPRSHQPGEGGWRERTALQRHRGNGGRKTPASKLCQGSSTEPDSGSPQGLSPTRQRQRGRVSELRRLRLTLPPCLTTAPVYFAPVKQCCSRKMKITRIPPSACQDKGWTLHDPTAANISSCQ